MIFNRISATAFLMSALGVVTLAGMSSNAVAHEQKAHIALGKADGLMPRAMTALATVPNTSKANGTTSLADQVNPGLALSWAEFIDPAVAASKRKLTDTPAIENAVWRYVASAPQANRSALANSVQTSRNTINVTTTWRSVVMEGARRNLTGGQALQEWLLLPMPEPRSNPWLSGSTGYRY